MRTLLAAPICLAGLALALSGCPDQPTKPPADQPLVTKPQPVQLAKPVPLAQPVDPARPVPDSVPDGGSDETAQPPEPLAPAELPADDPTARMYVHMDQIFGLLAKHLGDCAKAQTEVEAYVTQHRAEFLALKIEAEALEKSRSGEENKAFRAQVMQRGQRMIQVQMKSMMTFHRQCPAQMVRINELIQLLTTP
jgi:hypothetical protein